MNNLCKLKIVYLWPMQSTLLLKAIARSIISSSFSFADNTFLLFILQPKTTHHTYSIQCTLKHCIFFFLLNLRDQMSLQGHPPRSCWGSIRRGFAPHILCSKPTRNLPSVRICVGLANATWGISPVGPKTLGITTSLKKKKKGHSKVNDFCLLFFCW